MYRACGTVKVKEVTGETCKTTNGRTTCTDKYSTKSYSEGTDISGLESSKESKFLGSKICYRRGKFDYLDISKDRKGFAGKKDVVNCGSSENTCGGSVNGADNVDLSFCYKTYAFQTCPVQDIDLGISRNALTYDI